MSARVERARIEAERARRRFTDTLSEVQYRLKPSTIADSAWTGIKDRGSELADEAVDAVKARPAAAAGAAAAFLLYLARKPIISGATRLWNQRHSNGVQNGMGADNHVSGAEE